MIWWVVGWIAIGIFNVWALYKLHARMVRNNYPNQDVKESQQDPTFIILVALHFLFGPFMTLMLAIPFSLGEPLHNRD